MVQDRRHLEAISRPSPFAMEANFKKSRAPTALHSAKPVALVWPNHPVEMSGEYVASRYGVRNRYAIYSNNESLSVNVKCVTAGGANAERQNKTSGGCRISH